MWFKNLTPVFLSASPDLDTEKLNAALTENRIKPVGKLEQSSFGWTSPYGSDDDRLVHSANRCHLLRFGMQDRVLPGAVIKEAMADRLAAFAERTGRPAGAKQKQGLRDEVLMDLLPQAFVKPAATDLYIDTERNCLMIDSTSAKRCEDITTLLRHSIDGLTVKPVDFGNTIVTRMTDWLDKKHCDEGFDFGDECDLRDDRDEGAVARCRKQDLTATEIAAHLESGKRAVKMGLNFADRLSFAFGEEFNLARIKPLEVMIEQMDDLPRDVDDLTRLDAEFVFMALEYRALLDAVIETFQLDPTDA